MSVDDKPEAPRRTSRGLTWDDFFSERSRKQLGLFFAGAGFFALSTMITRRSLLRKYKASVPKFYQQSNQPNRDVNGAMEAFEALNIATINVLSVSMMSAGGLLWALDISNSKELKQRLRVGLGLDDPNSGNKSAEEEMEEWLATVLARKEQKEQAKRYVENQNDKKQ